MRYFSYKLMRNKSNRHTGDRLEDVEGYTDLDWFRIK